MKDLEGHLIEHPFDFEDGLDDDSETMTQHQPYHPLLEPQENSISDDDDHDLMEENLFDNNNRIQYPQKADNFINYCRSNPHQSINKPTDGTEDSINYYNHHNHHHSSNRSRSNMATSLPIQVPARRMRNDFYSMKLNMMKVEAPAAEETTVDEITTDESTTSLTNDSDDFSPVRKGDRNRPAIENLPAFDDDDAFLDQEYNENHYNHYVLDGLDDEHLTAEEDPMRLFASIQALAKSLHEDAELFGSLPPKRLLESPIRSIAFV